MLHLHEVLGHGPRTSVTMAENLVRAVAGRTAHRLDLLALDLHDVAERVRRGASLPAGANQLATGDDPPDYLHP